MVHKDEIHALDILSEIANFCIPYFMSHLRNHLHLIRTQTTQEFEIRSRIRSPTFVSTAFSYGLYRGDTTITRCPLSAKAIGRELHTSASPPDFDHGVT
jgi:hypothetical protein